MARLLLGALAGVAIGVVVGAALDLRAEPSEEVIALAAEANVPVQDLEAAAATVGVSPRAYAYGTGLLTPPVPSIWDRLATECEARGWANPWVAVSPGGTYRGGLQMDSTFWRRYGGLAFAPRPDLATREQQITVAQRGQAVQGFGAWPVCARRLGLLP